MSTTRPELHIVRDPGPQGAWLRVLDDVQQAARSEPTYGAHVMAALVIAALCGALSGSAFTILCLRALGALG